jgi:hypothetical protein
MKSYSFVLLHAETNVKRPVQRNPPMCPVLHTVLFQVSSQGFRLAQCQGLRWIPVVLVQKRQRWEIMRAAMKRRKVRKIDNGRIEKLKREKKYSHK